MGNEQGQSGSRNAYPEYKLREELVKSELSPDEVEEAIKQNAVNTPPVYIITDHPDITDPSRKITHFINLPGIDPIESTEE
jgi:hypothetical protein